MIRSESKHTCIFQRLNVQHNNLDAPLGQHLHHDGPDAVAASRHQRNVLFPVVRVIRPVVEDASVQKVPDFPSQAEQQGNLEPFQGLRPRGRNILAPCRVFRGEEQRKREAGIEDGFAEEREDGVAREACVLSVSWV